MISIVLQLSQRRGLLPAPGAAILALLLAGSTAGAGQTVEDLARSGKDLLDKGKEMAGMDEAPDESAREQKMIRHLQSMAPYKGYLEAHRNERKPLELLGGPIRVRVTQKGGGVFIALPDQRRLDPAVFGHPGMERAFAGTPGINGLPNKARGSEDNTYTAMNSISPFGNKFSVMSNATMTLEAIDKTATDAATSEDSVKFSASWKDDDGNLYGVKCCARLATHGLEFPTFGGVATNHILHGSSRIGTALMPTEFTYVDFWGMGEVLKNGATIDAPRMVHGMLTEYVRTGDYRLAFDHEVTPGRMHFHLIVAPFMPDAGQGVYEKRPVKTGFLLPNGIELPFWHVMFEALEIESERIDEDD